MSGYPPEDLVLKNAFLDAVRAGVEALAADTADGGPGLIVGAPWLDDDGKRYNAALVLDGGKIVTRRDKYDLPNYGVFDEKRVFDAGAPPGPVNFRGVRLGLAVCEDMWTPDVCETLQESGAEILIIINGSPYERRQSRCAAQPCGRPGKRNRLAVDLHKPSRRPGRIGVRWRFVRAQCRPQDGGGRAPICRKSVGHALAARATVKNRGAAARASLRNRSRAASASTRRWFWACAIM